MSIATSVGATRYIEMECQAEPNISVGFLMGRLMHSLHIGLVNATPPSERCPIGVTFPDYRSPEKSSASFNSAGPPIGSRLRLFAQDEATLDGFPWHRSALGDSTTTFTEQPFVKPEASASMQPLRGVSTIVPWAGWCVER